jgi:hypothetical protein
MIHLQLTTLFIKYDEPTNDLIEKGPHRLECTNYISLVD